MKKVLIVGGSVVVLVLLYVALISTRYQYEKPTVRIDRWTGTPQVYVYGSWMSAPEADARREQERRCADSIAAAAWTSLSADSLFTIARYWLSKADSSIHPRVGKADWPGAFAAERFVDSARYYKIEGLRRRVFGLRGKPIPTDSLIGLAERYMSEAGIRMSRADSLEREAELKPSSADLILRQAQAELDWSDHLTELADSLLTWAGKLVPSDADGVVP